MQCANFQNKSAGCTSVESLLAISNRCLMFCAMCPCDIHFLLHAISYLLRPPQPCCVLKGSDGFDLDFTLKINLISALRQLVTMSALSRATSLTMRSRSSSASCSCSMSCRNRDEIQRLAAKMGAPAPGLALLERSFPALGTSARSKEERIARILLQRLRGCRSTLRLTPFCPESQRQTLKVTSALRSLPREFEGFAGQLAVEQASASMRGEILQDERANAVLLRAGCGNATMVVVRRTGPGA